MLVAALGCSGERDSLAEPLRPTLGISTSLTADASRIERGSTISTNVTVVRGGGYTGVLTLSATGAPTGVTVSFAPAALSGTNTGTVASIAADTNVAPGAYPVTVMASGEGVSSASTTVTLTVTANGSTANMNWTFCNPDWFPVWFAYQNGPNGTWTRVEPTGTTNRNYAFRIDKDGAYAYVRVRPGGSAIVSVSYVTLPANYYAPPQKCPDTDTPPVTKTLAGTVAGLDSGQYGLIFLGGGGATAYANGPITMRDVAEGTADLFAYRSAFDQQTFDQILDRMILRRQVNAATTIDQILDFEGGDSFAAASAPYTITNRNGEYLNTYAEFHTARGIAANYSLTSNSSSDTTIVYGVPAERTVAGDVHVMHIYARSDAVGRGLFQYTREIKAQTLRLSDPLDLPRIATLGSAPYRRFTASGAWQNDYRSGVSLTYERATGNGNVWSLSTSPEYGGGNSSTWNVTMPDFSTVSGFNPAWGLGDGPAKVTLYGSGVFPATPSWTGIWRDGDMLRYASRTFTLP